MIYILFHKKHSNILNSDGSFKNASARHGAFVEYSSIEKAL